MDDLDVFIANSIKNDPEFAKEWAYRESLTSADMKNCLYSKNYSDCENCPLVMFNNKGVCINFEKAI